jgi:CheY-like chemotaxis protein
LSDRIFVCTNRTLLKEVATPGEPRLQGARAESVETAVTKTHRRAAPAPGYNFRRRGANFVRRRRGLNARGVIILVGMKEALPTSKLNEPATTEPMSAAERLPPLVLVVDDVLDNAVVISLALQHRGYRVVTATDGAEALKIAALTRPDIILMDIAMPQLDGLAATRRLREDESLRAIPVIALTAFDTEGFRRAAYDAGIDGYLTKPVNFDRLYDLINSKLPNGPQV